MLFKYSLSFIFKNKKQKIVYIFCFEKGKTFSITISKPDPLSR